jgi:hypothetical protein
MTSKEETLKMVIDYEIELPERVINACKEALEQPAQEVVAWIDVNDRLPEPEINFLSLSKTYGYQVSMYSKNPLNSTHLPTLEKLKIDKWMPIPKLYTHPHQVVPTSTWQGLTDDEINEIHKNIFNSEIFQVQVRFFCAIEQALRIKNAL